MNFGTNEQWENYEKRYYEYVSFDRNNNVEEKESWSNNMVENMWVIKLSVQSRLFP